MNKKQLIVILAMGVLINLEFLALLFLIYFSHMPLILFFITVTFQLFSFSLIGVTTLFLILEVFGVSPQITLESWKAHLKESLRLFAISLIITFLLLAISALVGGLIVILLKRASLFQSLSGIMEKAKAWINAHFY